MEGKEPPSTGQEIKAEDCSPTSYKIPSALAPTADSCGGGVALVMVHQKVLTIDSHELPESWEGKML